MTSVIIKDSSVWRMLGVLASRIDFWDICVIDHWDAYMLGVGLARSDDHHRLVYVCTRTADSGLYSYECEDGGDDPYRSVKRADGVTLDELVEVIKWHLGVGRSPDDAESSTQEIA